MVAEHWLQCIPIATYHFVWVKVESYKWRIAIKPDSKDISQMECTFGRYPLLGDACSVWTESSTLLLLYENKSNKVLEIVQIEITPAFCFIKVRISYFSFSIFVNIQLFIFVSKYLSSLWYIPFSVHIQICELNLRYGTCQCKWKQAFWRKDNLVSNV